VPKSEQHQLFTKFYRASNARKQRPDGTGIGLFMAKKVIVAHGGSIIFGTKEGQGSTFGFRLPLKTMSVSEPARTEATQLVP
jgi:signal transduction histidine kinase